MERGRDPRGYALYAFGGSGGLHACALADRLGIRRIVVPPAPGVFSATGLSAATPGVEVSATLLASPGDASRLRSGFESLERRALARLRDQGISAAGVRIERLADLRYQGQSHEIAVPFGPRMARRFEAEHRGRYGHVRAGAPIEVVTIRLRGTQPEERRVSAGRLPVALRSGSSAPSPDRLEDARNGPAARGHLAPVHFRRARVMCRVLPRESIPPGKTVRGPARVTEYSATTFIPPGWKGRLGPEGALVLTPSPARGARRSRGAPSMRGRA
jgi:N-methylhydantoinase A